MFAHNLEFGITLFEDFAGPLLGFGKTGAVSHAFAVEHHEQGVAVSEVIAYSFVSLISVERVGRGVLEVLVGQLVFPGHVVVVAVKPRPHIASESILAVHLFPERPAPAPGAHISKMKHPVESAFVFAFGIGVHGLYHIHR